VPDSAVHVLPNGSPNLADLSREQLIDLLMARREGGIRIDFSGKDNARKLARRVRPRVMRSFKKYSSGPESDQARNCLIEGDNLQAMATLFRERGQVDLILTDPPYNTGNDWRYNDRWDEDPNDPGVGDWVTADDGARHTKWMRFMWPRIQMMKAMLKPSGVLAICIDHRELFRLGQMLDELFRQENRLAIINWQRSSSLRNDKSGVSTATEYVLVYAKDREKSKTKKLQRTEAQNAAYSNPDGDPDGPWTAVTPFAPGAKTHPGMVYAVQHPFTGKLVYPSGDQCWKKEKRTIKAWFEAWGSDYVEADLDDGHASALLLKGAKDPGSTHPSSDPAVKRARKRAEKVWSEVLPPLIFTKRGEGLPRLKTYLKNVQGGVVPSTFWGGEDFYDEPVELETASWRSSEAGTSEAGARELASIVGADHGFETVKPLRLFEKIVQIWCPPSGLVLDAFAGSGTTGHAVLNLNATANYARRFILIEQGRPERGDSYARSLTADRLQRVVSGNWKAGQHDPLNGGYRFATLDKKVDADALLNMEREDLADTIIASHFDAGDRKRDALVRIPSDNRFKYLVAKNSDSEGFFLIWNGSDGSSDFTEETYAACAKEAKKAGLTARYHIYARLYLFQTSNVDFYQIPDRILMDFGLDLRGEPYHDDDET
jgi:adenine-specific DNA-methyltransferase